MDCNPRYSVLFEPVQIGPVVAPNRFYQTPHATGLGNASPESGAALRGIKAEGGWGVVCTEYCSIHPSSDDAPFRYLTLWDEDDVRSLALTSEAIHAHGSLAGIELWHGGSHTNNRMTREPLLAPSAQPSWVIQPGAARAMSKEDIKTFRGWHREAAVRAMNAGFDIVCIFVGHSLPFEFLSRRNNHRTDEYGGSLENRVRLLKELIEETKEAVGHRCAVSVRLSVDEFHGPVGITSDGEARDIIASIAELPDLWDVNLSGPLGTDSRSSRFGEEGFQENYVSFVKSLTTKPVVGVGRFTSPETMASQVKRGILDFIGAARPSIADPFLPRKIAEGREDEIRECIGCNICRAANNECVPLRCTQNPTMGEEWRRGWHPEKVDKVDVRSRVLVVGGGPAGLECALTLGRRGYEVAVADEARTLGGRVNRESALPGLSHWGRVRDYRLHMLSKLTNVEIYPESRLNAAEVLEFGARHIVIATGSRWRRDGVGSSSATGIALPHLSNIVTPDDIFSGAEIRGPVVIYDDEHYAIPGALAEKIRKEGHDVCIATPQPVLSSWTQFTDEQAMIQQRLMKMGVQPLLSHQLVSAGEHTAEFRCVYTGSIEIRYFGTLVLATGRLPADDLYDEMLQHQHIWQESGLLSVRRIGDCLAPSSIADAVFSGHRAAREMDLEPDSLLVRRERALTDEKL